MRIINKKYIIGGMALMLLSINADKAHAQEKEYKISLEEVTELAINNNFDVQLAKYDAQIAETNMGVTKSPKSTWACCPGMVSKRIYA